MGSELRSERCPSDIYNQPTIYESFCIQPSTSTTFPTVPSKSDVSYSIFGDKDCGKPMAPQRLLIDFTPNPKIDNHESQKKCCEFWDFIKSHPDIKHLKAVPDPNLSAWNKTDKSTPSSSSSSTEAPGIEHHAHGLERTAVSMLEICEGKDLIKRAFEPKMCISHCSQESREYVENEPFIMKAQAKYAASVPSEVSTAPEVVDLCKALTEWDKKHPKSMDPPGHVKEHRPILQRIRNPPI